MASLFASGTIVDERYELLELIGEGGNGVVYKARELELERTVAIKFLHTGLIGDHENLARFKRESAILSELQHPNILKCYRFGIWHNNIPYIAMELLSGQTLNKLVPVPADRAIAIVRQICRAMDYAHQRNVIHRDLKPGNILVDTETNAIKVLDFGLARLLPAESNTSQHLTQTGTLLGSTYYMSPEQCMGRKADCKSDIYSLGCILYELIAGEPPLVADTPIGLMHLHVNTMPASLLTKVNAASVPGGLDDVVLKAMSKRPEDRFHSMTEFENALELVETGDYSAKLMSPRSANRTKKLVPITLVAFVIGSLALALVASMKPSMTGTQKEEFSNILRTNSSGSRISSTLPVFGEDIEDNRKNLKQWLTLRKSTARPEELGTAYKYLATFNSDAADKKQCLANAVEAFGISIKHHPQSDIALSSALGLVELYMSQGLKLPEAVTTVREQYSKWWSPSTKAFFTRQSSIAYFYCGRYQKALETMHSLPSVSSADCALLSVANKRIQNKEQAQFWAEKAEQCKDAAPAKRPHGFSLLAAAALLELDRPEIAKKIARNLRGYERNFLMGAIYTRLGKYQEAKETLLKECRHTAAKCPILTLLLRNALAQGSRDAGRALVREIIETAPDNLKYRWVSMLPLYIARDDRELAEEVADSAAATLKSGKDQYIALYLAKAYNQMGKPAKALTVINKAGLSDRGEFEEEQIRAYSDLQNYSQAEERIKASRNRHTNGPGIECSAACILIRTHHSGQVRQTIHETMNYASEVGYFLTRQVDLLDQFRKSCELARDRAALVELEKMAARIVPPGEQRPWRDIAAIFGSGEYGLAPFAETGEDSL
jgi:serine/threonine protein kinase